MEGKTLQTIVNMVFSNSPKPPCTYNLALPDTNSKNCTMFQFLMSLLVSGAKKLYGENITPAEISEYQFSELKCYIESVGYIIKYNYSFLGDPDPNLDPTIEHRPKIINIWFEQYNNPTDCHGRRVIC